MAKGKYERWRTAEGIAMLEGWARSGLTDDQIAQKMGCSRSTLALWKNTYSDISDALKKGKEVVDTQVESALLRRAIGYDYDETQTIESEKDGKKTVRNTRHMPPDVTAQIFWLKNRRPDRWREKQEKMPSQDAGVTIVDDV